MKIQYFALLLLSASVLVSCSNKEEVDNNQKKPAEGIGSVSFSVSNISASGTRSEADFRAADAPVSVISLDIPGCEESFSLVETVSSMDEGYYSTSSPTRATLVTNDNFDSQYGIQLYGTPYETASGSVERTTPWDVKGPKKLDSNGEGELRYDFKFDSETTQWPESNSLIFFLQAPYETTRGLVDLKFYSDGKVAFEYTDPGITSQKDLLFASSVVSKGATEKSVNLYHVLAAVQFSAGNSEWNNSGAGQTNVITRITNVTLKDVYSSGYCEIATESGTSDDSGNRTKWSEQGNATDYSLNCSSAAPLPSTADDGQALLLIPQSFAGKQIDMEFVVVSGGVESEPYRCSVTLPSGEAWEAGEMHKFSLVSNRLEVSVKSNKDPDKTVTLSNTGNVPAYVRAGYVVGYINSSVSVPAADATGCFTDLGLESNDWIAGSDGFYYYKYPVKPGCSTASLYSKFTLPTETSLVEGATPQLSITLQGVPFDEKKDTKTASFTAAWGSVTLASNPSETVLSKLSTAYKN